MRWSTCVCDESQVSQGVMLGQMAETFLFFYLEQLTIFFPSDRIVRRALSLCHGRCRQTYVVLVGDGYCASYASY